METNNYVESWHKQLKTTYLNRKSNRRVDRLIFILVRDILLDYVQNVNRMSHEKRRRAREVSAEDVNEAILKTAIEQLEDSIGFKIRSFSNEEVFYTVKIAEENMQSCNFTDFT
ncbi:hypothetical protein RMATCC62417_14714 [Rhizopus microsporus]|nr:hypothetical protein RMATCC62417_14714 [Rhizopus microsporus]